MDNDIAIKVENVSKSFIIPRERMNTVRERVLQFRKKMTYETFHALTDLSFEIKKGEFFSIIGRNGSGKSTLLKILAGIYTPDTGNINVDGEISPFLELGVGFNPELSGKDNIYLNSTILGLSRKEIDEKYRSIVAFSELDQFIHLKLKNYSSGMQVRLAFATAIQSNRDIFIMDEVLAVGDVSFQMKCFEVFEKIINSGKTVVFVSHDTAAVQKYSDRVLYLEDSRISYLGSPDEALRKYTYTNAVKSSQKVSIDDQILFTAQKSNPSIPEERAAVPSKEENPLIKGEVIDNIAEIIEVQIYDKNDNETIVIEQGDKFLINVTINIQKSTENLIFKMVIRNSLQQELFVSNSHAENIHSGTLTPGKLIVSYELPNYFAHGKYSISPSVCDNTQRIFYDWRNDFATFQVHQPNPLKPSIGFDIPHTIKLIKR